MADTFRSLRSYNYRIWSIGALVSNVRAAAGLAAAWVGMGELRRRGKTPAAGG